VARILFLTQVLPFPLDAGPKVRAYHMLRHLAQRHEILLVSFVRTDDRPEAAAHLREFCTDVRTVLMRRSMGQNLRAAAKGIATGTPIVAARDEIPAMTTLIRQVTAEFKPQVVHADQLSMAGYGQLAARSAGSPRPATILDEHNAIYLLTQRIAATQPNALRRAVVGREAHAFVGYEADMCNAYDHVFTVTAEDKEHLISLQPPEARSAAASRFTVVPICVDPADASVVARRPGGPPTVLHLGTMFWPPNVAGVLWFATEVLPRIHRVLPETRFLVVGKSPPQEVIALSADPRIEITGYVADPAPYLASADAFVVPLLAGGGMRVKILDAWLWGMPVVSTPIGAEGIATIDGENILLAAAASDFAAKTLALLNDQALNTALRLQGRAWVEANYAWQNVYPRVDEVYDRLLSGISSHQQSAILSG
jgi:glycosyltransferase involved in cell wall biosynthesis